jgi:hypothetical protein
MKATNWKAFEKGTLRGFFDLLLDSGLEIRGMTYHVKDGKRWVSFPSRAYEEGGETKYTPILRIEDDARWRKFQGLAKQAVEPVMGDGAQGDQDVPF